MKRTEVRIAGFGGQGVVLAGVLLGTAAALYDGKHAVQTQSYGAAARGGAARSDVIIDGSPIVYPQVTAPDIMVAFTLEAMNKYRDELKEDAILILDRDLVQPPEDTAFDIHLVPAATTAAEEFGKSIVANLIMLGYLVGLTEIVSRKAAEEAILANVPKGTEDLNLAAFKKGFDLAKESL